jgi:hypothetical protein
MADGSIFDWACDALESATTLDRLEARGTLRLALKGAGLDARSVNSDQLQTVIMRVLPPELEARGVSGSASICDKMAKDLASEGFDESTGSDSPENIFARLGGG